MNKKMTISSIQKTKGNTPLVMITAYDALFASLKNAKFVNSNGSILNGFENINLFEKDSGDDRKIHFIGHSRDTLHGNSDRLNRSLGPLCRVPNGIKALRHSRIGNRIF